MIKGGGRPTPILHHRRGKTTCEEKSRVQPVIFILAPAREKKKRKNVTIPIFYMHEEKKRRKRKSRLNGGVVPSLLGGRGKGKFPFYLHHQGLGGENLLSRGRRGDGHIAQILSCT